MKAALPSADAARSSRRGDSSRRARSQARQAAVQALYQIDLTAAAAETVVDEFLRHRFPAEASAESSAEAGPSGASSGEVGIDRALFASLVRGTTARREEIDRLLTGTLAEAWSVGRLDMVLRAALRAGIYELLERPDVPAKVAINEYVDVAKAFLASDSAGFVNGVLDRLAHRLRADELGAPATAEDAGASPPSDHAG